MYITVVFLLIGLMNLHPPIIDLLKDHSNYVPDLLYIAPLDYISNSFIEFTL